VQKNLIETAYKMGEKMGLAVWTQDEAGPYQTKPYAGASWEPEGQPKRQSHEYVRNGTAKILTLFHPQTGQVCVKGVTSSTNVVLHPRLKEELSAILDTLPKVEKLIQKRIRAYGKCGRKVYRSASACQKTCLYSECC
jgi:hypothetical protein